MKGLSVGEAVFVPVLLFGGGLVMVVALGLTMTALRAIGRVGARLGLTGDEAGRFPGGDAVESDDGRGPAGVIAPS